LKTILNLEGAHAASLGSNVSYNLKKMVELGLLDYQPSRVDRRSVRIRLTVQGQEIHRIVDALYLSH
jgi:DNA-binding MarR family transcriptional regulator